MTPNTPHISLEQSNTVVFVKECGFQIKSSDQLRLRLSNPIFNRKSKVNTLFQSFDTLVYTKFLIFDTWASLPTEITKSLFILNVKLLEYIPHLEYFF